ncbi:hypothetical protein SAMN04487769_0316 [Burkholderia sp. b14]|nr:Awr [Burkholderia sp.]SIT65062.1 hypothetical protein SAMN04487769_0316 [Burkholderia sp. b14]
MPANVIVSPSSGVVYTASPAVEHAGPKSNRKKSLGSTAPKPAATSRRTAALHELRSKIGAPLRGKQPRSSVGAAIPARAIGVTPADYDTPGYSIDTIGVLGVDEPRLWTRAQLLNHLVEANYPGPNLATAELAHQLHTGLNDGTGKVSAARAQLVLFAMHEAGLRDSTTATMMLRQLRTLNFDQPFHDASAVAGGAHLPDQRQAWRASWETARVLARTEYGFETLLKLRAEKCAPLSRSADRDMLHVLLDTAERIENHVRLAQQRDGHATSVHAALDFDDPSPSGTAKRQQWLQSHLAMNGQDAKATLLASQVFAIAKKYFDQTEHPHSTSGSTPEDRFASFIRTLAPSEKEALFDWQQRFHESGRGTDKAKASGRLNNVRKVVTSIIGKVVPAKVAALFNQRPGLHETDKAKASHRLNKFVSEVALRDREHCGSHLIQRIRGAMKAPMIATRIPSGASRAAEKSSAADMQASASDHASAASTAEASELTRAASTATQSVTTAVADATDSGWDALKHIVPSLRPGMAVEFSDGGELAVTTERVSASVTAAVSQAAQASPVPLPVVVPSINAKRSRKRKATVQMGCTEQHAWLFIGTAHATGDGAGVGVLVGASLPGSLVGGTVGVQFYDSEHARPRGILVQVARQLKEDGSGYDDEAMQASVNHILDTMKSLSPAGAAAESRGTSEQCWNTLAQSLVGARDVSVGWIEGTVDEKRHGASTGPLVSTGVPIGLPAPLSTSVSASVPVSGKHVNSISTSRNDSGRMSTEKRHTERSIEVKIEAKVGASISATTSSSPKSGVSTGPTSKRLWDKQIYQVKVSLSRTLQTHHGKIDPRACFLDVDFPDATAYEYATRQLLNHDGDHDDTGIKAVGTYLEQKRAQSTEPLANQVASAVKNVLELGNGTRQMHSHIHRYALTDPAAEQINLLQAHFEQHYLRPWEAGSRERVSAKDLAKMKQVIEAKREQILADPTSWRLASLITKERSEAHESAPILSPWARGLATALLLVDANVGAARVDENEVVHHRFATDVNIKPLVDVSMSGIMFDRLRRDGSHTFMGKPRAAAKGTRRGKGSNEASSRI